MTDHEQVDVAEGDINALTARLEDYAAGLSPRERKALRTIILTAMEPLERIKWRDTGDFLNPEEEAELRAVEQESGQE